MTMIVICSTHIPPSVNAMYRNVTGKGRVKTERYKIWQSAAGWDFNGKGKVKGKFHLRVVVSRKNTRSNSDIDNRIKPILDLLQKHNVIENDSLADSIHIQWGDCEGIYIEVEGVNNVDRG